MTYARLPGRRRSWHVVVLGDTWASHGWSLCGRSMLGAEIRQDLPAEKSCESCLRIAERAR